MNDIQKDIEIYLEWLFQSHKFKNNYTSKIIHDNLWGTEFFEPHELFLIDTPLMQRLRRISQTGLSVYTYPSTTHNRFSHSLGVYSQVKKLLNSVLRNTKISDDLVDTLKLAALSHDFGHAPFSHSSEEIYGHYPEIFLTNIKKKIKEFENNPKPHEILSYLIVKSDFFKSKIVDEIQHYWNVFPNIDILANSIVGYSENTYKIFLTEFINGSFDADKLDYLMRDGLYSGLPLKLDLERLWHSVEVIESKFDIKNELKQAKRLTIKKSAVSLLEQIVFAKMILFMSFYHHHKVRAAECMYKGLIEYIQDNDISIPLHYSRKRQINFKRVIDFLYIDDSFFQSLLLSEEIKDKNFNKLLHKIIYRRLLKRAVTISYDTIRKTPYDRSEITLEEKDLFNDFLNLDKPAQRYTDLSNDSLRIIAREIWDRIKDKHPDVLKEEIWLDIPFRPHFSEAESTYLSPFTKNDNPVKFINFFPSDKWAEQYVVHKYKAHVFCPEECVTDVARVFKDLIYEKCRIKLNDLAFLICKGTPPND